MITTELLVEHGYKKTAGIRRDNTAYCKESWMKIFSNEEGVAFALQFDLWQYPNDNPQFAFYTQLTDGVTIFDISSPLFAQSITDVEKSVIRAWEGLGSVRGEA